ncbi:ATP-dependent chaperone ClpB [bacterium]|nr:ATP-dependent chaperone ClpB [bacterium]
MDIQKFTVALREVLTKAAQYAQSLKQQSVEIEHLLHFLLENPQSMYVKVLEQLGADLSKHQQQIKQKIDSFVQVEGSQNQPALSGPLFQCLSDAEKIRDKNQEAFCSTEHFLQAALNNDNFKQYLNQLNINEQDFLKILQTTKGEHKAMTENAETQYQSLEQYTQDLTAIAREKKLDPVIGRDTEIRRIIQVLSRRSKNNPVLIGEPGVGKTAIAEGLAQRIVSNDVPETLKNKKLLSLDLGAMIAGAKYRGEFEDRLKAVLKEIKSSNGEIVLFIDELHTIVGAGASEGAVDASNLLKPSLARGELRCIGATTLKEYKKYIEKDAALERRFQPVYAGEPSVEDAISILRGLKEKYEVHHGVRIADSAIIAAAKLSNRYITDRFLPDKAIDLMDEAASRLRIEIDSVPTEIDVKQRKKTQLEIEQEALKKEKDAHSKERLDKVKAAIKDLDHEISQLKSIWDKEKNVITEIRTIKSSLDTKRVQVQTAQEQGDLSLAAKLKYGEIPELEKELEVKNAHLKEIQQNNPMLKEEVEEEDIAKVVALWTGIPLSSMLDSEKERLKNMQSLLNEKVIGQDHALEVLTKAIKRSRAGIADPNKPMGSFMFLGPTGVGKTETAKALADFLFHDEQALLRIDMSEYMEKHSVARLIGAPPGYVGYEEGGKLSEAVRRRPYAVILFDEIEKAHPDVFNVFLQILDEGRLTDGQGRTVDFKNTVLIMTSNLAGKEILASGEDTEKANTQVMQVLREFFKPEFLNRVDDFIIFNALNPEQIKHIVDIQIQRLQARLKEKNITIKLTDAAREQLAKEGFDPLYGARPLKRVIQQKIENTLAEKILDEEILPGHQVLLDYADDHFQFELPTLN